MPEKKQQLNVRLDPGLIDALKGVEPSLSEFIREAIKEKFKRDKRYQRCPTCKGVGYVKRQIT